MCDPLPNREEPSKTIRFINSRLLNIKGRKNENLTKCEMCGALQELIRSFGLVASLYHIASFHNSFTAKGGTRSNMYDKMRENKSYSCPPIRQFMAPTCCVNRKQLLTHISQYRSSSRVFNWIHLLMLHSAAQVYNLASQQAPHRQDNGLEYQ